MGSNGGDASRETLGVDLWSGLKGAAPAHGVRSIRTIPGGGTEWGTERARASCEREERRRMEGFCLNFERAQLLF